MYVPDGSVWYSMGLASAPVPSIPATNSDTPNGRLMVESSPVSPNCIARLHTACVTLSTGIFSLYVNQ